ncbi:MAG TPA: asparagine synthase (glutamine-hydrolyzing) [Candidatus Methanoperedenaceae archaeon]|nr:asparagine synthase (glutamine-hydrolyzing) [Candidatus Methanoperedenaceae archaeon]
MCGITGILNFDGSTVDSTLLESMAALIRHRGPDDEGYYFDDNVGLGHRRLSIIDLQTGHQPMSNEDETIWIVFNGEIYNYLELRKELLPGHKFRTQSDTEVLIHLYEEYGERCLDKLNGMFAFAIWDTRKRRIFAARDRLGIKPFYYFSDGSHFIFSSEIKAILKHPAVRREPDHEAIIDYLTFQFCLGDKTLFNGIKKLLPGYYLILDAASHDVSLHKYWDIQYSIDTYHTEDYFSDKLLMLIEDAIRLQLRSDVPLGAYLSGGLDSSTVTCIASMLSSNRIKTFTGGFNEGRDYDETEYAKLVSKFANTEYFEIFPEPSDFMKYISQLIYHMDEPVAGPGLFPQYLVSKLASENVKVALGGQGGDEVFGGYARYLVAYLEQCIKGTIFQTQDEGKHVVTLESIIQNLVVLQNYRQLLQYFWSDGLFEPMDNRYFKLVDRSSGYDEIYTDDFKRLTGSYSPFESFKKIFNNPDTLSYFNKMTYFDMKTLLPALLQVEDRVSMAVSLESRVPLLDHRIVELIASIPPTMKFKGGELRYIYRKSVKNIIPREILERKDKMGFPVPLQEWFKGDLKDYVRDILLSEQAKKRGIFRMEKVERLIEQEKKFGRQVWGMLCLELWFREFIDDDNRRFSE